MSTMQQNNEQLKPIVKDVLNKPLIVNKQYYDVYGNTEEDEDDAFTEEENEDLWQF